MAHGWSFCLSRPGPQAAGENTVHTPAASNKFVVVVWNARSCRHGSFGHGLLILAALLWSSLAAAEHPLFSSSQWENKNLHIEQSSAARFIEAILAGNPNFELLSVYSEGSRLRRLSRPIGRLDVRFPRGNFMTCTASLIGADTLLTNHHCIPGDGRYGVVTEARLLMGYYSETDLGGTKSYRVRVRPLEASAAGDYSVLRVEGRPGETWGTVRLVASEPRPGEPLLLVHHPAGRPKHVTRGNCRAGRPTPSRDGELYHKCDTLPGSSGAPIFSADTDKVLALHYAGAPGPAPGRYNYGKLVGWLRQSSVEVAAVAEGATSVSAQPSREDASGGAVEPPTMVRIAGGCFAMGSPNEEGGRDSDERQHRVCVEEFQLAKHEVTVGEFRAFVQATGYRTEAERWDGCYSWDGKAWKKDASKNWRSPGFEQGERHPVVCVSWNDAQAYVAWLNRETAGRYRLPTEAEWEYAARAGTVTSSHWGNDPEACRYANVHDETSKRVNKFDWPYHRCDDGYSVTAPVGRFEPNGYRLYDMLGNVREWACSAYRAAYGGEEKRCADDEGGRRVFRGGAWPNGPGAVRAAARVWRPAGARGSGLGFRLAMTP